MIDDAATWHASDAYRVAAVAALIVAGTSVLSALRGRRTATAGPRRGALQRLSWLGTWLSVAVLGLTAFGAVLIAGALQGYLLMLHTVAGGALTVALAGFAVTWAGVPRNGPARATFWAVLVLGLTAAVSMLASMLTLFESTVLELLLDVHRWSGLGAFVATALHLSLLRAPAGGTHPAP